MLGIEIMATRPLSWSQRVTLRMIADGRSPAGGDSYLDTTGLGIPGATIRSLRQRGLIEPYSWGQPRGWVLTAAGVAAVNSGSCDEPDAEDNGSVDSFRHGHG